LRAAVLPRLLRRLIGADLFHLFVVLAFDLGHLL
jgi:hypothetical protein